MSLKTRTRTIVAFLLLLLGFTPLLFTITFHLKREGIRERMKEKLETSTRLETIIIPANEVVWMDDHEIWVEEQMFDIYSKELKDGKYTFKGHFDKEETKLVLQKKKSDEKHQDEKKILTKFFKVLPNAFEEFEIETNQYTLTLIRYGLSKNEDLVDHFYRVATPPPEFAHSI